MNRANLQEIVGKTITEISGLEKCSDEVYFSFSDGSKYKIYHQQDCCESVLLEDVDGEDIDFSGAIVISAEEPSSDDAPVPEHAESYTWTFYKIETSKGGIFMRWLGESNGYYGEGVDFERI